MLFKFNRTYFLITLLLFFTEILIALYLHDKIIRPYIGDLLVVILIYCFLKSFLNVKPLSLTLSVLFFAYFIEFLQYLEIVDKLGLREFKIARIVIGTSFSWEDILAYSLGAGIILLCEKRSLLTKPEQFT